MKTASRLHLVVTACVLCLSPSLSVEAAPIASHITDTHNSSHHQIYNFTVGPNYRKMVRQVLTYIPDNFNFGSFRNLYSQTEYYNPMGEDIRNQMLQHAFIVQTSENPEEVKEALSKYRTLLYMHLANIDIVTQALSLARQDSRLGDEDQLKKVKIGLFKSILLSGDGTSLNRAYNTITLMEETMLLSHLGFKVEETEYVSMNRLRYNMHLGTTIKTQEEGTVFVDVTVPMKYLERMQRKKKKKGFLNFKGQ